MNKKIVIGKYFIMFFCIIIFIYSQYTTVAMANTNYSVMSKFKTDYEFVPGFSESRLIVKQNGKYGYMNLREEIISPIQWDKANSFFHGLAIVKKDDTYGIIDKQGNVIVEPQYEWINDMSEGYFLVKKDGKYGFLNELGEIAIPLKWDKAGDFQNGFSVVKYNGKYGCIDKEGNLVVKNQWDRMEPCSNGLFPVVHYEKNFCGFINPKGEIVSQLSNDYTEEGRARVQLCFSELFMPSEGISIFTTKEGLRGYANVDGDIILPPQENILYPFENGVGIIEKRNGTYSIIDINGNLHKNINIPGLTDANRFSDDVCVARVNIRHWGFFDINGELVTNPNWRYITNFQDDTAIVMDKDEKYTLIDKTGKVLNNKAWDYIAKYGYGDNAKNYLLVENNKKYGLIDNTGNIILAPQWDGVSAGYEYGMFIVRKDDINYVISLEN